MSSDIIYQQVMMIVHDHIFMEPVKIIKSVEDVKKWEESEAYGVREIIQMNSYWQIELGLRQF